MSDAKERTCNRHDDCDAADARAKAAREKAIADAAADPKWRLPAWRAGDGLPERADHCHDEGCDECFGN